MVRWVVGSIHDWRNKDRGMCYPVCGMVHIKEPFLLIEKSSPCGGCRFPISLSEWSFTICQCSTTGVPKTMVCAILHIQEPLLLIGKSSPCGSRGFPISLSLSVLYYMSDAI